MTEEQQLEVPVTEPAASYPDSQFAAPVPPALPYLPPPKSFVRDIFEMAVVTAIQLLFLWTFIAQGMMVPTGSMQNTINIGDRFFANKFIFGRNTPLIGSLLPARDIQRGDVIIFKFPQDPAINYVKRVIGMPGDEVRIRGTQVFINGRELPEQRVTVDQIGGEYATLPEVATDAAHPDAPYRVYYQTKTESDLEFEAGSERYGLGQPVRVPDGHYFVMGDNRDNSLDSRYWGFVPRDNIIGHALYVHWSYNAREPETQQSGSVLLDTLQKIQWKRIGQAVK